MGERAALTRRQTFIAVASKEAILVLQFKLQVLLTRRHKANHVYEVRPRKDHRGVDLISDVLPFGRLWYGEPNATSNAIRLVFLIETQPTDCGTPNRNPELGGSGARRLSIFLRRVPFIRLMPLRVIAWRRFGYAKFRSRSHDAVIRVYDAAGNVIETHEHTGEFGEW